MKIIRFAMLLILFTYCKNVSAVTKSWTNGTGNNDWNTALNWIPVGVPTENDDVIISGFSVLPLTFQGSLSIGQSGLQNCRTLSLTGCVSSSQFYAIVVAGSLGISSCNLSGVIAIEMRSNTTTATVDITNSFLGTTGNSGLYSCSSENGGTSTMNMNGVTINGTVVAQGLTNGLSTVNVIGNSSFVKTSSLRAVSGGVINATGTSIAYDITNTRGLCSIQTDGGNINLQNCTITNTSIGTGNSQSILTIANSSLTYNQNFSLQNQAISLKEGSTVNWSNTNITATANHFAGASSGNNLFFILFGRGIIINGNINLLYPETDKFVRFSEFGTPRSIEDITNPPILNGDLNIAGGGISYTTQGVLKINGNVNNTSGPITTSNALTTLTLLGSNFEYGGQERLSAFITGQRTLILGGNTDTYINWPTNMYVDQLVIDKENCHTVTMNDKSLVIGSNLKLLRGKFIIPANTNPYKLVVSDSLIVNTGAALICQDNGANKANIAFHRDNVFSGGVSPSVLIDNNVIANSCNGINLTAGTKLDLNKSTNIKYAPVSLSASLGFLQPSLTLTLKNHLTLNGQIIQNYGINFFPEEFHLKMTTVPTGSGANSYKVNMPPVGVGKFILPVGISPVTYRVGITNDPGSANNVILANTGTFDFIGINLRDTVFTAGNVGVPITNNWVKKLWTLNEETAGGSNLTASFEFVPIEAFHTLPGFNTSCYVSRYSDNAWDILPSLQGPSNGSLQTQTRSNITDLGFFSVTSSSTPNICAGNNFSLPAGANGTLYQWQVNTGSGFSNITDGVNYSGTAAQQILLLALPSSFYGYQYRCLVNNVPQTVYDLKFNVTWYGNSNVNWFNTNNWGCNTIPNQFTDVVVPSGIVNFPVINNNTQMRSLSVYPGVNFVVTNGAVLTIGQ